MHGFSPFLSPPLPGLFVAFLPLLLLALIWTIVLKGYALWFAARNKQTAWFVALLIVNTLGILELIYLVFFRSPEDVSSTSSQAPKTPASSSGMQA